LNTKALAKPRPRRTFYVKTLVPNSINLLSPDTTPMRARWDSDFQRYIVCYRNSWYHLSYESDGTPWIDPARPIPATTLLTSLRSDSPSILSGRSHG
jgi:hypothetical protein